MKRNHSPTNIECVGKLSNPAMDCVSDLQQESHREQSQTHQNSPWVGIGKTVSTTGAKEEETSQTSHSSTCVRANSHTATQGAERSQSDIRRLPNPLARVGAILARAVRTIAYQACQFRRGASVDLFDRQSANPREKENRRSAGGQDHQVAPGVVSAMADCSRNSANDHRQQLHEIDQHVDAGSARLRVVRVAAADQRIEGSQGSKESRVELRARRRDLQSVPGRDLAKNGPTRGTPHRSGCPLACGHRLVVRVRLSHPRTGQVSVLDAIIDMGQLRLVLSFSRDLGRGQRTRLAVLRASKTGDSEAGTVGAGTPGAGQGTRRHAENRCCRCRMLVFLALERALVSIAMATNLPSCQRAAEDGNRSIELLDQTSKENRHDVAQLSLSWDCSVHHWPCRSQLCFGCPLQQSGNGDDASPAKLPDARSVQSDSQNQPTGIVLIGGPIR